MPDPRFFERAGPFRLSELAQATGAQLAPGTDGDLSIRDVAPLSTAGGGDISFLDNPRYRDEFKATKAAACIVTPQMLEVAPVGGKTALLLTNNPYKTYALAAQIFYPDLAPQTLKAPSATVHPSAVIDGCRIDEGVVIEEGVEIGSGTHVEPGAVIRKNVKIGKACRIGANAVVSHALIGDRVRLYPGCCVGQDGFGFAIDPKGHVKVPQLGRVIIEDSVEIGSNTCVDRGSGPDTVIGQGTWIDNLVQIGHNVKIGRGCVIAGQVGISGSTVLEDYVVLAGQVGLAGHLRIGKGARIAAQSGVLRDIAPGEEQMGYPALPIRQFMRQIATLGKLTNKKKSAD